MRGTARDDSCQVQIEALEQELTLKGAHLRARHQNGCRIEVEELKQRLAAEREDVETELKKVRMEGGGGKRREGKHIDNKIHDVLRLFLF